MGLELAEKATRALTNSRGFRDFRGTKRSCTGAIGKHALTVASSVTLTHFHSRFS